MKFGIVALSKKTNKKQITKATNLLKQLKIESETHPAVLKKKLYFAGSAKSRAKQLMYFYKKKDITGIICIRGGYGAIQILKHLDYNLIKKNPKPLIGYSDITILLNYIFQKTNIKTIHGPMIGSERILNKNNKECFLETIKDKKINFKLNEKLNPVLSKYKKTIKGISAGGNLSLLIKSLKTPYEINTKNKILFIEEVSESGQTIYDWLYQLYISKKLDNVKAIIFGSFTKCKEHKKFIDLFCKTYLTCPIIFWPKFGHSKINYSFKIGRKCVISPKKQIISFT